MKFTNSLISTLRDTPKEAEVISHQLMLRGSFIRKLASGIYNFLPLGLKVVQKVESIIRSELNQIGASEVLMPMVLPAKLWEETGRWQIYGKELLRLKDRHEQDFCLGPTHEEIITDMVRREVKSYRQLPLSLYQIQTKFRDEIRPRFGLMRGREFIMKDCYSFDLNEEEAIKTYWKYYEAYNRIFTACGLKFRAVEAATGLIGGNLSHEFQVLAETGEDEIYGCSSCEYAANQEKAEAQVGETCPKCGEGKMESFRGIEVGQVFHLGNKYSSSMDASYLDADGKKQEMIMGCYGIGVTRTVAAAIEQNHDDKGMIWPEPIAPFQVELINLGDDPEVMKVSSEIYEDLCQSNIEVIWDDRDVRAGVKFNDADLIGIPWQVVVGSRGLKESSLEVKERLSGNKNMIALDQLKSFLNEKLNINK